MTDAGTAISTRKTITVTNVNDGASTPVVVTAYQIVKGTYKDGKLTDYVLCDPSNVVIADKEKPTAAEITVIADKIQAGTTTLQGITMTRDASVAANVKYTAQVEAGLYIVLATGADETVYNPAVVAVNITDANNIASTAAGSEVDMTAFFDYPADAYLKSGTSGFNKDIVSANAMKTEGDVVAFGDKVDFKLYEMTIPSYSDDYGTGIIYKIEDNLDTAGFKGIYHMDGANKVSGLLVKVGGTEVAASGDDDNDPTTPDVVHYTITYKDAAGTEVTGDSVKTNAVSFELNFTDAYIRAHGNQSVEITYSSVFQDTAGVNYAENKNTAKLSYSIDPTNPATVKTKTDSTYHYTIAIDGVLDSQDTSGTNKIETYELNKVKKSGETYVTGTGILSAQSTQKSPEALSGAQFTLYDDAGFATVHQINGVSAIVPSDANGHITFKGLDTGTYYMKETAAPGTYTLNEKNYQIVIAATLNDEGAMTSYSITINSQNPSTGDYDVPEGSAVYAGTPVISATDDTITNTIIPTVTAGEIVNTKIAQLPATGGTGTIVLTVVAAIGMGGFLTLYLVNRRKKTEAE